MKIKLSKSQWERIGKTAGWTYMDTINSAVEKIRKDCDGNYARMVGSMTAHIDALCEDIIKAEQGKYLGSPSSSLFGVNEALKRISDKEFYKNKGVGNED